MLLTSLAVVAVTCAVAYPVTRAVGRNAGWILAVLLVAAAALVAGTATTGSVVTQSVPWMPTLGASLALRLDGLSLLFALIVLVIGAAVLVYSARYLGSKGSHASFYVLMTAFAAAMLMLVLADDLVVMFVAWEITTLCSFFLISRSGPHAREPAIRTLLVTAMGGLLLLAAVAVIAVGTGTTSISGALSSSLWSESSTFTTTVAVLLAGAAFTKSAQFPFQSWLPDSMVAITPVSAYLHAAAMVKAGIYLLLRFSPALAGETVWTVLLVSSGLVTALFGAAAALRRFDLKELLAYSTISQLGLLVVMIGVGTEASLTAAVLHTLAHALFKVALFMLIGVIDHEAGTRDIRELASMRLRMPVTATALTLAAASMAGVPLLLGFVSKEFMLSAFVLGDGAPAYGWFIAVVVALVSALTFAYSGRIVLGAFAGREGRGIAEAPVMFWAAPFAAAATGLVLGILPSLADGLISGAAHATTGAPVDVHLSLWHGFNAALVISAVVIAVGTALIVGRVRVGRVVAPLSVPISGLRAVDRIRAGIIRSGEYVGRLTGTRAPRQHLAIPIACLTLIALLALIFHGDLPAVVGNPSRPLDWVLIALVLIGVVAAMRARSRISAVVVTGVVGFTMTLWYFSLGAADVAITQLLVEILTVCVMVLLLRRLPRRFKATTRRQRIPALTLAIGAGLASGLAVWALTGRREISEAATWYLNEAYNLSGGGNIVNTILVDFRALDTLGELTVLGVAGLAVAALLAARQPNPVRTADLDESTPLFNSRDNVVFIRYITRILGPLVVVGSLILLVRGHYEPGGGFISALIGGAGIALLYISAPSDKEARIRWPYLALIGAGVMIGAGAGFVGFQAGSFLTPIPMAILGWSTSTSFIFDIGVYLAVLGVVLASFNLLGMRDDGERTPDQAEKVAHP